MLKYSSRSIHNLGKNLWSNVKKYISAIIHQFFLGADKFSDFCK